MRIVLTGCAGYIGSRLVHHLKQRGHNVTGIDRNSASASLDAFIQCDLLEPECYVEALSGADLICHLAAAKGDWGITPEGYQRDNLDATRALIEAAKRGGPKRWVFYSTVSVLGPSQIPLAEGASHRPITAYGSSKAACETLFESYATATPGAQVLVIRPSVVYGPGNPENTNIFRLIDAIYRNRFTMVGRGPVVKTTSYIDNLIDAHMFLMDRYAFNGDGYQVFHYVDAPRQTTGEIVAMIRARLRKPPSRRYLPLAIASPLARIGDLASTMTGVDLPITSARIRKFCTPTNFSAEKLTGLGFVQRIANDAALSETVDWYLSSHLSRTPRRGGAQRKEVAPGLPASPAPSPQPPDDPARDILA